MKEELSKERKLRKSAEHKTLSFAHQGHFGDGYQRVKKKTADGGTEKSKLDREKEKDDFDETTGTLRAGSVDCNLSQSVKDNFSKECNLSNRLELHRYFLQKYF